MEKENLIVVTACDDKYCPHSGAMLASLFTNNSRYSITANILTDDMSALNRTRFQEMESMFGQKINVILVDKKQFEHLPIGEYFADHINICTYYRLLAVNLFPQEHRILYLDSDIIIRHDVSEFWKMNLDNCAFAGVKDVSFMLETCPQRLSYPVSDGYFNAGVGLYNLDYLRSVDFNAIISEYIASNLDNILYHDQDILNACFHGKFKSVSEKWNMVNDFLLRNYQYKGDDYISFNMARTDASIVHFTSLYKPWYRECQNPYKKDYWKYLKMTPWKEMQPQNIIQSKLKRYKYYLKEYIKKMLGVLGLKYGYIRL